MLNRPYEGTIQIKEPSKLPWVLTILVLGGAGYGAYWGMNERNKLVNRATTAEVAAATAETARKTAEQQLKALETEKAELLTEREALAKSVAAFKGTQDKLQEKMKDEIARGDVALTTVEGKLRVDLVDKILFESGDAKISKRGEGVLARVGAVLKEIDDKQIQVFGHTDNARISDKLKKEFPTNWELSTSRATNVVRFLQEKAGVPGDRLVASGQGEWRPVASNRNASGRTRNRRIEVLLLPSLAPKKISAAKLKEQALDKE